MTKVWAIATNTLREAVRDRILYLLLGFALILILGSAVLALLTVGSQEKIIKDVGLSCLNLFSILIAVFVGINLVAREISRKTADVLLARPVSRTQFVLGKFLGLALTVGLMQAAMTACLSLLLLIKGAWDWPILAAAALIFGEALLMIALAIFFSTFCTLYTSSMFTLASYLIGHTSWGLRLLRDRMPGPLARAVCDLCYYAFPNLELFNVKAAVVHGQALSAARLGWPWVYLVVYLGALLTLACAAFQRRNLT